MAGIIRRRRSTRHFTGEAVTEEDLLALVEAGANAPSGSNTQNQRFLLLTDPDVIQVLDSVRFVWPYKSYKKRRAETERTGIIANAAAVIVVFADSSLTGTKHGGEYYVWENLNTQNCSAAIQNILLLGTAMGLGTCWVSATEVMNHSRLLSGQNWRTAFRAFAIPPDYHIQGLVLVGRARKTDADGFPVGEGMHGTNWTSTVRGSVEQYIIRESAAQPRASPGAVTKLSLRVLVPAIRGLLLGVRLLERAIYRIEAPYLTSSREGSGK